MLQWVRSYGDRQSFLFDHLVARIVCNHFPDLIVQFLPALDKISRSGVAHHFGPFFFQQRNDRQSAGSGLFGLLLRDGPERLGHPVKLSFHLKANSGCPFYLARRACEGHLRDPEKWAAIKGTSGDQDLLH